MGTFIRLLMKLPIFKPLLRLLIGALAIPLFRLFLRRILKLQNLDAELEKDLEHWFRGSLLLLVATANMEDTLFGWIPQVLGWGDPASEGTGFDGKSGVFFMAMRIMLAIGVTEAMPDQELFSIIHPGPPKLRFPKGRRIQALREQCWPFFKGLICQHLNRSSQVLAILSAIFSGSTGWTCYVLACIQYLIIGLVTSKDRALDVLSEFDKQIKIRRRQLVEDLHLAPAGTSEKQPDPTKEQPPPASETPPG